MSADQFEKKSEAWSALFSEPMSELVQRYTSSVTFDRRLWRADIAGSRLSVFEHLGHVPQEEDPAATVSAVKAFLGANLDPRTRAKG